MAADVLALLPGVGYGAVMDFSWDELVFWHGKAASVAKRLRGAV
jgi:hypothetical protein